MMLFSSEVIQLLSYAIRKHGEIKLPAQGNSMFPYIRRGNECSFIPCVASSLRKGDIVLFSTSNGQLIAHRYYETKFMNGRLYYLFKGDANLGFDEPVSHEQIIGKLASIHINKADLSVTDTPSYIWSKLILAFPKMSYLLRFYLKLKES